MNTKKYIKELLLGVIIVLILGIYGLFIYEKYYFFSEENISVVNENVDNKETINEKNEESQFVEIKGEVVNPGVYPITESTIVNDIVVLAGGFTKNAYTKNINLSKKLSNETVIYIYTKYEYSKLNEKETKNEVIVKECNCPTVDISSCLESGSSIIESNDEKPDYTETKENLSIENKIEQPKEETSLVNINTASKDTLMTLNGIGESKADSIINYRTDSGLFKNIEDIKLVTGISDKIYEKIKDFITV